MHLSAQHQLSQQKIANIEFLRLVFMIVIILYHFIRDLGFYCIGGYAFIFYFILSGFFLTIRFDKSISLWNLLIKKIKRFYPLLILSIAMLACFRSYIGPLSILNNLLFNPTLNNLAIYTNWYLNILIWVSLFYGYLIKHFVVEKTNLIIGCICFLSFLILESQGSWLTWHPLKIAPALKGGLFIGLFGMGLGYFLAQYFLTSKPTPKNYYLYTSLECLSLGYALLSLFLESIYLAPIYMSLNFLLLIYLFILKQGALSKFFEKPVFLFLGQYTLAIYLIHPVVIEIVLKKLKPDWILNASTPFLIVVMITLCVATSIFIHYMSKGLILIKEKYMK